MRPTLERSLNVLSLVIALLNHLSQATAATESTTTTAVVSGNNDEQKRFEDFRKSSLFLEPFDWKVLSLPEPHLTFVRELTKRDLVFYREILNEAIASRNKMAPSVRLVLKYGGKVIGNLIKHRREEKQLSKRVDPQPEFHLMLAKLTQDVLEQSDTLKKNYSKKSKIDIDNFRARVEAVFDHVERTINASPLGAYMKWNQLILFKDQAKNGLQNRPLIDETADLMAQFRAMGYESTSFVVRRIINLLRLFARGLVPSSEKEVV